MNKPSFAIAMISVLLCLLAACKSESNAPAEKAKANEPVAEAKDAAAGPAAEAPAANPGDAKPTQPANDATADDASVAAEDAGSAGQLQGGETGELAELPVLEPPMLSDEQLDLIALGAMVACYFERVPDPTQAQLAVDAFLEMEGLSMAQFREKETALQADALLAPLFEEEKRLCESKVLVLPADEPELSDAEKTELAQAEAQQLWSYARKTYKGTVNTGGVTNGRIQLAFKGDGKTVAANFSGRIDNQTFSLGFGGSRSKQRVVMSGGSGKTNTGKLSIDFEQQSESGPNGNTVESYRKAKGTFSGTVLGKPVSFAFELRNK